MTLFSEDLAVTNDRVASFSTSNDYAWFNAQCSKCDSRQMAVIAFAPSSPSGASMRWLRCVTCFTPHVESDGVMSPSVRPLAVPGGMGAGEEAAWEEVLDCLSVGANTSAVMMCRKLLLHVAIDNELAAQSDKGRSPSFVEAVDYLEERGVITAVMRHWVDQIKDVGNVAAHEITVIDAGKAMNVARFVEQLLKLAYEIPYLAGYPGATDEEGAGAP